MTSPEPVVFEDPHRHRRLTYLVIGIVLLVLLIIGYVAYRKGQSNQDAQQKADQLISAFQQAGMTSPSREQILRTLGDDGGAVCADPGNALKKAMRDALGANGAAGPGLRPVFIAEQTLRGEALVLQVYCPDQLPEFQRYIDGLELDDVVRE